jgi:hypothetical protein
MNVPFPPFLLWPVVIAMVVGAFFWRRWQNRAILAAPPQDWPRHAPRGCKHFRIFPWLLAIAGVIGAYSLWRFSAPCVYGRVVDATTGKPVAGALVMRTISRKGPPSLAESGSITSEPFSFFRIKTRRDGRFLLPGWVSLIPIGIAGTSGIAWVVYHPGLMPGRGCVFEGFAYPSGCGGEGSFSSPDPWVLDSEVRHADWVHLEVRLYPPTLEGVTFRAHTGTGKVVPVETPANADPWGEYFRRLNVLVQVRYLRIDEFAKEAKVFLGQHQVTEGMIDPLAELADRLPFGSDYELFANAVISFCNANPATSACSHVGPRALAVQYSRRPGQK